MNEKDLELKVVDPVITQSDGILVNSPSQYTEASDFLKELKSAQKQVIEYFADIKQKAHDAWKAITIKEKSLLDPLKSAETTVKSKMIQFQNEQEKKRLEEEKRLQAEAEERARKEREKLEKRAEKLKTPELAEQAREQAENIVVPIVNVPSSVPKVGGISTRKIWKAKVVDKLKFIEAAIKDHNLAALIIVDQSRLDKLASATQGELIYPGIEFYQESILASGGK